MNDADDMRSAFQKVYAENHWMFGSGPGSTPRNTVAYRAFLEDFIHSNGIRSVTDLGCGDWQFSRLVDWSACIYTGFDIVPELVETNRARFGAPNIDFQQFRDIESLPGGDLVLAKEVLQHLPNAVVFQYLPVLRKKYRYALITNSVEPSAYSNSDVPAGGCRPLRLRDAPFFVHGANVLTYFVFENGTYWKNEVLLMMGEIY